MAPALVEPIARAVKDDRVTALAAALGVLRACGTLDDTALFPEPAADRYTRKLIWADPAGRFTILGMSWAPGQRAPLHDHAGLWGGEIVVAGTMAETSYELEQRLDDRFRFRAHPERIAPTGTVGLLSPPNDYHAMRNAGDTVARTLHVYSGDLRQTNAFYELGDGWCRAMPTGVGYDV